MCFLHIKTIVIAGTIVSLLYYFNVDQMKIHYMSCRCDCEELENRGGHQDYTTKTKKKKRKAELSVYSLQTCGLSNNNTCILSVPDKNYSSLFLKEDKASRFCLVSLFVTLSINTKRMSFQVELRSERAHMGKWAVNGPWSRRRSRTNNNLS